MMSAFLELVLISKQVAELETLREAMQVVSGDVMQEAGLAQLVERHVE
jgi:hypothetical protein